VVKPRRLYISVPTGWREVRTDGRHPADRRQPGRHRPRVALAVWQRPGWASGRWSSGHGTPRVRSVDRSTPPSSRTTSSRSCSRNVSRMSSTTRLSVWDPCRGSAGSLIGQRLRLLEIHGKSTVGAFNARRRSCRSKSAGKRSTPRRMPSAEWTQSSGQGRRRRLGTLGVVPV